MNTRGHTERKVFASINDISGHVSEKHDFKSQLFESLMSQHEPDGGNGVMMPSQMKNISFEFEYTCMFTFSHTFSQNRFRS